MGLRVTVRPARPDDLLGMAAVYVDAYGVYGVKGDPERYVDAFRISMEVEPRGCYVAEAAGRIVGTACYYNYGGLAWVGAVGVVTGMQRRGIGRRLVSTILQALKGMGVETVRLDSTNTALRLYASLGFRVDYETVMYRLESPPSCEHQAPVTESHSMPEEVLSLDREAFGADRGKVFRPFLSRGARILVAGSHGVEGYAMVYGERIGPLIASSPEAACSLLASAYRMGGRRIIIPSINPHARAIVEGIGRRVMSCTRMTLGKRAGEKPWMIYGILNWAKG